ncbi:hypothetical protein BDR04DRAFT_1127846 [Suillus decipiens]|nr:hypothetical protein BDR04DRAFT_1127846 [Suillus decipiens]
MGLYQVYPTHSTLFLWTGTTLDTRLTTFLNDNAYNQNDVHHFNVTQEKKLVARYLEDQSNPFSASNRWKESSPPEDDAPKLKIQGVHHQSLVKIITEVFEDHAATTFHMTPFHQMWKISDEQSIEVFSEVYSLPAMLKAYTEINSLPHAVDDNLEHVVASLMMYSNLTHLSNFGDTSLWPFYLFFGKESKYTCRKPTASACHHVAYIPSIPDDFQDLYFNIFGDTSSAEVHTHCKWELIQAIWKLLLDEDFMWAYEHGLVICCGDRVTHRVEVSLIWILIARIKFLGECLCPCCLVKKADVPEMGTEQNMCDHMILQCVKNRAHHKKIDCAHKLIFEHSTPVDGRRVKSVLNSESLIPTHNTFLDKLYTFGFNLFLMLVVDMLHEFELDVWKAIFTHLLCIVHAAGGVAVQELNWRYAIVPSCPNVQEGDNQVFQ